MYVILYEVNNMKNAKTILFASLIAAMILPFSGMQYAAASHPVPTFYPFDSKYQSICYQMTLLDNVKINGQTNKSSLIKTEVEKARNHVSGNTVMNISYDSTCNYKDNEVRAKYFSSMFLHAATTVLDANKSSQYKWISFNTNSYHNFIDSGSCNWWESENIKFVANHEFGHFAGLGHASDSDSDSHTMMKSDCTPGYAIIKTSDKNQINGLY